MCLTEGSLFTSSFDPMKDKNIQYIFFLLLFTGLLDFAFGSIYDALYFSEKSRQNDRLIHSVLGTNEDILIFGSSRALHHYNPQIIEDSLGMTCYNVGSGGQNIYYHKALLEATLERYTPKMAILELMSIDFEITPPQWDTEKLGVLLPFARRSAACMNAVLLRGESEQVKLQSAIYPFNSLQYPTLRNNVYPFYNSHHGFIPINRTYDGDLKPKTISKQIVDADKMIALYRFVEICQEKDIELFVFVSPHYVANNNGESVYKEVSKHLHEKFNLNVYNVESNKLFLEHPEYFADPFHLNNKGAKIFTSIVAKELQTER